MLAIPANSVPGLGPDAAVTVCHHELPQANAAAGTYVTSASNTVFNLNIAGHIVLRVDFECGRSGLGHTG